ncbi:MAG: NADPH-dependent glutamate synthase [Candidatus Heimdallarchaeota archaeon]|nr:NADPH-dependent glutamate synthase [Candidatus Heimdallarchaeota archaeon]
MSDKKKKNSKKQKTSGKNKSKKQSKKTSDKKSASKKKRSKRPPRVKMSEQPPEIRVKNFDEVPYGLTPEEAKQEASRCLQCKRPKCVDGCPVSVQIPEFIALIAEGKFVEAACKVKETNVLPAVCGRVCPQETQCEATCVLGRKYEPVAIGYLERFCADYERLGGHVRIPKKKPSTGKKVAIIGSGPAGLTVAGDLALLGYDVTIFEAFHKGGGVLAYGIPEFRLPKEIVNKEINYLEKLGVSIKYNHVIGMCKSIDELLTKDGFDAVFIGVGAGLPRFMDIPGENLNGVYSANEYLTRSNLMKAYLFPTYNTPIIKGRRVTILGGGNVAMDCARTALRLGSNKVTVVYRRSREQMPARQEEIHHAEDEGIEFRLLSNLVEIIGDEKKNVTRIKCQRYELGDKDSSGRRRPIPIEGDYFEFETDLVIIAIGNNANPLIPSTNPDIKTNKWGNIKTDEMGRTSKKFVYAAGDIVTGAATVISAMGGGRKAAQAIHYDLMGIDVSEIPTACEMPEDWLE